MEDKSAGRRVGLRAAGQALQENLKVTGPALSELRQLIDEDVRGEGVYNPKQRVALSHISKETLYM